MVYRYSEDPGQRELTSTEREIRKTRLALRRRTSRRHVLLYSLALLLFLVFLHFITQERIPHSD